MQKRATAALVLLLLAFVPAASADSGYFGSGHLTSWSDGVMEFLGRVWEAGDGLISPIPGPEGRLHIPGGFIESSSGVSR